MLSRCGTTFIQLCMIHNQAIFLQKLKQLVPFQSPFNSVFFKVRPKIITLADFRVFSAVEKVQHEYQRC